MNYAEQLAMFVEAVTGGDSEAMLKEIATARHNSLPTATRLNVYRNAYEIRLVDATISDYKALKHYMGDAACRALIAEYVRATPSHHWDLNPYAFGFADYVAQHHADNQPVLALAQLEAAIARALWAPESPVLDAHALTNLTPEILAETEFTLRTALCLVHVPCGAESYVHAFRSAEPLDEMPRAEEYVCVLRHPYNVYRHMLEPTEYQLLVAISKGMPFGAALEEVAASQADEGAALVAALPNYLNRWFQEGFFAA